MVNFREKTLDHKMKKVTITVGETQKHLALKEMLLQDKRNNTDKNALCLQDNNQDGVSILEAPEGDILVVLTDTYSGLKRDNDTIFLTVGSTLVRLDDRSVCTLDAYQQVLTTSGQITDRPLPKMYLDINEPTLNGLVKPLADLKLK